MSSIASVRPSFWSLVLYVTLVHLFFLGFAAWDASRTIKPKLPDRLIVKTIALGGAINPHSTAKPSVFAMAEPPKQIVEPVIKEVKEPAPVVPEEPKTVEKPKPVQEEGVKKTKEKETPPKKAPVAKVEKPKATPKQDKPKTQTAYKPKAEPKKETKKVVQKSPEKPKEPSVKKQKSEEEVRLDKEKAAQEEATKQMKAKQQELIARAQASISKVDTSKVKSAFAMGSLPSVSSLMKPIDQMHIDALPVGTGEGQVSPQEASYIDEVVNRLKLMLRLPEYGDVKVKLTLERNGKVAKVVIVSAKSTANKEYIEKNLPKLNFPAFGKNFSDEPQYTFSLVLCNE